MTYLRSKDLHDCFGCGACEQICPVSDLTIGDYWGIEREIPALDAHEGVSLILVQRSVPRISPVRKLGHQVKKFLRRG